MPKACEETAAKIATACYKALERADDALTEQANVITQYDLYVTKLSDQNDELTASIERLQAVYKEEHQKTMTYTILGVLTGITLGALVLK